MAEQFLGVPVLVTLQDGTKLKGVVSSINPTVSLTLRSVYLPATGRVFPEYTVQVSHITAVETDDSHITAVETNENADPTPSFSAPAAPPLNTPIHTARLGPRHATKPTIEEPPFEPPTVRKSSNFEDPAILSMGRRPLIPTANLVGSPKREHTKPHKDREQVRSSPRAHARPQRDTQQPRERKPSPAAKLIDPASFTRFEGDLKPKGDSTTPKVLPNFTSTARDTQGHIVAAKTRKPRRRKNAKPQEDTEQGNNNLNSNGWRQTPLLQPTFQPYSTLKKQRKPQKNGWGTEDASDVQEMGDFDFEGNLLKFDKNTVFGQIQAEDQTADEERLVSHNRIKPGTAGGKNLHYTENVLDTPNNGAAVWNSEAGDSDEDEVASYKGSGSGRNSRMADTKSLLGRRSASRKASSITSSIPNNRPAKPSFYLTNSNRKCDVISALQALNLENIAMSELGLTSDMMDENGAQGIAKIALNALSSNKKFSQDGSAMPIVVVFAGNNKAGQRAIAAARHLRNHGVHAIVCVLGLEREPELLEDLRKQLKVFRSFGGKVFGKVDLIEHLKTLDSSVELIIDGLLGITTTIEELRTGDQATAFELISWANRSTALVLAIDIPSGIDPTSGKIAIIEGSPLYLNAKYVASMSAPKKGLLQAMIGGEGKSWETYIVDIGIGDVAFRKAGTKLRRGVEFDQDWVVGLRYQSS